MEQRARQVRAPHRQLRAHLQALAVSLQRLHERLQVPALHIVEHRKRAHVGTVLQQVQCQIVATTNVRLRKKRHGIKRALARDPRPTGHAVGAVAHYARAQAQHLLAPVDRVVVV